MGLNKWKESARQAYRDQQLQDNEGGCGEPVGFVTGFIEACKQRQSEIEKLEKELQNTREILKKNPSDFMLKCGECGNVVVWYEQCTYIDEIASLKKELQATREQLEKAEKTLLRLSKSGDGSHKDKHASFYDCLSTLQFEFDERKNLATSYFTEKEKLKQKDEVKE